jgi:hypothetical protein
MNVLWSIMSTHKAGEATVKSLKKSSAASNPFERIEAMWAGAW